MEQGPFAAAVEQCADELVLVQRLVVQGKIDDALLRLRLITGKMKLAAAGIDDELQERLLVAAGLCPWPASAFPPDACSRAQALESWESGS